MTNRITIAIYMRLSQDDGDAEMESNSIRNQRHLLRSYVAEHFKNYELLEFQDDGYSGANFNRPGISDLFMQARNGKIQCIVVKDLSRFSRDYIETGSYLEQIFPFAGIRFIAVNDGYDSDHHKGDIAGMDLSFKYLINDLYCKDISEKVKSALTIKKEKGIYANGSCIFGYRKDPKNRHALLIVEEEAAVVKRIFQMTMEGISSYKIAQQFHMEGIRTPIEYKIERGAATRRPKGQSFAWNASTICHMLRDATYAGDMVYSKYETPEVSGRSRLKPRSEWKVFRNHHEAIIDRETFEAIQKTRGSRKAIRYERHPLTGKMECGCCHKSLKIERTRNPYFYCGSRYVTKQESCVGHVNVQFMEQYILFRMQEEAGRQIDRQRIYVEIKNRTEKELKKVRKRRDSITVSLELIQKEQMKVYEAYALQKETREEYMEKRKNLQKEVGKYESMQKELDERIAVLEQNLCMGETDLCEFVLNQSFLRLTPEIADRFLERIVVYDEEHIEVKWKNLL